MIDSHEVIDYSLVICTYNPDERILKRCLNAVMQLDTTNMAVEVILVDNNSQVPLADRPFVQAFKEKIAGLSILRVLEQGLSHARIAGIEQSRGNYIVCFDDDNEPDRHYIQELKKLNTQFPEVGAWGPGIVEVDFMDGIAADIEVFASYVFQKRTEKEVRMAREHSWQPCYPFGTGLSIKAALLKEYAEMAKQGRFTASGRKGNKLMSGEDTQMVFLCISKGYAAGVAPSMKITHMIPGNRANRKYLERLIYGNYLWYETCLLQVFPEQKPAVEQRLMPAGKFSRVSLKKYLRSKFSSNPHRVFKLVGFIAQNTAIYTALNKPVPGLVNRIIKSLRVE